MVDKQLKIEVDQEVNRYPFPFWGFIISLTSISYAVFHLTHDGLLYGMFEPRFQSLSEDLISWTLLTFGVMKLLGTIYKQFLLMRIGIVGLSGMWGLLMLLSTTYAFGAGYPTARFITTGFVVIACLRVSFKGDFG